MVMAFFYFNKGDSPSQKKAEPKTDTAKVIPAEDDPQALYLRGVKQYDRKSYKEGIESFTRAAEKGHRESQNELGYLYRTGTGAPADQAKSLEWYRKAADQGHKGAKGALKSMGKG